MSVSWLFIEFSNSIYKDNKMLLILLLSLPAASLFIFCLLHLYRSLKIMSLRKFINFLTSQLFFSSFSILLGILYFLLLSIHCYSSTQYLMVSLWLLCSKTHVISLMYFQNLMALFFSSKNVNIYFLFEERVLISEV